MKPALLPEGRGLRGLEQLDVLHLPAVRGLDQRDVEPHDLGRRPGWVVPAVIPILVAGAFIGAKLGGLREYDHYYIPLAAVLALGKSYRRARLLAFLHPWSDPQGIGYQNIQSQVSLASGGWFGVGLGASRAKWGFLPNAHTDFIFAIIGEELGLVGSLAVVALFVVFAVLGVRAAARAPDRFGMLLASGITAWIVVQAFVNIGAVAGVLPITGVPLPFVSFGGSALLFTMCATGVLLNVARQGR